MTDQNSTPDATAASAPPAAAGTRKSSAKPARSRSREFALQALYQHIVGRNEASDIDVFTRDLSGFHKADSAHYDALIALGCIIRGETYHFDLVANESGAGVSRVSLDYNLPIANAILTTENLEQAVARQTEKGRDAARVAVEMACLMEDLSADLAEELDDEENA